jgi:hypothetical protein
MRQGCNVLCTDWNAALRNLAYGAFTWTLANLTDQCKSGSLSLTSLSSSMISKRHFPLRGRKSGTFEWSRQIRFGKTRSRCGSSENGKTTNGSLLDPAGVWNGLGEGWGWDGDDVSSFRFLEPAATPAWDANQAKSVWSKEQVNYHYSK